LHEICAGGTHLLDFSKGLLEEFRHDRAWW